MVEMEIKKATTVVAVVVEGPLMQEQMHPTVVLVQVEMEQLQIFQQVQ
tara:strand:+ start:300 stop:443 length:144 start_codon:yes stop_codon:yes gene_type:complete